MNLESGIWNNESGIWKEKKEIFEKKCPVYLKLPWIGNISRKFEKQVKSNVQNCF